MFIKRTIIFPRIQLTIKKEKEKKQKKYIQYDRAESKEIVSLCVSFGLVYIIQDCPIYYMAISCPVL